jgi:hypothetical protein
MGIWLQEYYFFFFFFFFMRWYLFSHIQRRGSLDHIQLYQSVLKFSRMLPLLSHEEGIGPPNYLYLKNALSSNNIWDEE